MSLRLFDFECSNGHRFEELVQPDVYQIICPECLSESNRQISGTHIDPRLGLQGAFPTMCAKWGKKQRQRAKTDKIDGPNLWMH